MGAPAGAQGLRTWLLEPMLSSAIAWSAPWAPETPESPDSLLWEMPSCIGTESCRGWGSLGAWASEPHSQPDAVSTPIQGVGESGPKAGSEVSQDPDADMGSPARLHLCLPSGSNLPCLS